MLLEGKVPDGFHIPSIQTHSEGASSAYASSYPVRMGESAQSLIDGVEAFSTICDAVRSAKSSICLTVSYMQVEGMKLPGYGGHLFDLLWETAQRGIHVRCIVWAEPILGTYANVFNDRPERLQKLLQSFSKAPTRPGFGSLILRWDRFPPESLKSSIVGPIHCHHQKSWVIDGAIAFVGGMNIGNGYFTTPGHEASENALSFATVGERNVHDIYLKLTGSELVQDVLTNFADRWNNASSIISKSPRNRQTCISFPSDIGTTDHLDPVSLLPAQALSNAAGPETRSRKANTASATQGTIPIQLTRTMPLYPAYSLKQDVPMREETSILGQYLVAIKSAQRYVYIENQSCQLFEVLQSLNAALERGVHVAYILPSICPTWAALDTRTHDELLKLKRHRLATVGCLAINYPAGRKSKYYYPHIHAKLMIVDDEWLTVGSCNVAERSFKSDTELNASVWSKPLASSTFRRLIHEHTSDICHSSDAMTLLAAFKATADSNATKIKAGQPIAGHVVSLNVQKYGRLPLLQTLLWWYIGVLIGLLVYVPAFPHSQFRFIMQYGHLGFVALVFVSLLVLGFSTLVL